MRTHIRALGSEPEHPSQTSFKGFREIFDEEAGETLERLGYELDAERNRNAAG